jgi:hypothetical protein
MAQSQGGQAVSSSIHYAETQYGFDWGSAKIWRCVSDKKKGWVVLFLETPKHQHGNQVQIYVTKTGKVRISDATGEWRKAKEANL